MFFLNFSISNFNVIFLHNLFKFAVQFDEKDKLAKAWVTLDDGT